MVTGNLHRIPYGPCYEFVALNSALDLSANNLGETSNHATMQQGDAG
jgi:hypothetical protein